MTIEETQRPAPEKCRKAWEVYALAMQHPQNFDMDMWVSGGVADLRSLTDDHCGTTACLAGWAAASEGHSVSRSGDVYAGGEYLDNAFDYGMAVFGLTYKQADRLFYAGDDDLEDIMVGIFGPCPADLLAPQS